MKLFVKFSFMAIAFAILFGAVSVTETNAQVLNEILKRMEANRDSLSSLQANITMVKYNSQLDIADEPLVGTTMYLPKTSDRGMYLRINWSSPVVEQIAIIGDEYTLYRPENKQAYVGNVNKAKNSASSGNALSFMSMSKSELRSNYTVKLIGEEKVKSGTITWHLELTPKSDGKYNSAELWVDVNGMPVQAKVIEKHIITTVLLSSIKKNITIKDVSIFQIKLPKGIKPVKA